MAATRERRANAGNKMGRMLDAEEEDDFYKTTYGGFDEELPCDVEISVDVDSVEPQKKVEEYDLINGEKCSRTFITFTDERIFKEYFPQKKSKPPVKQYCPVTKKPAKYFDPITQTPYSSLKAFKCIREAYAQQLEEAGNKKK